MDSEITNLSIINVIRKPKSSLIIIILLFLYNLFYLSERIRINIPFRIIEKLVTFFVNLSKNKIFLFNKLSSYSKSAEQQPTRSLIEIHSMVSHESVTYYILMIKSLQHHTEISSPIVVHDDGSITKQDQKFLKKHLPGVKIITYEHSTKIMKILLKKYPCLLNYRLTRHKYRTHLISTVDIPYFTNSRDIFYIDGDILFFNKPLQICKWLKDEKRNERILFTRDHSDTYILSEKKCREVFHVGYLDRFNMGILCFPKKYFDIKFVNKFFKLLHKLGKDDALVRDQTYYMIYFQKRLVQLEVLDEKKYLTYGKDDTGYYWNNNRTAETISCHYTTTVRESIYKESIVLLFKMKNLYCMFE